MARAKYTPRRRTGGNNITPFVDVLLVVLVIFILTSNASIPGIKVDLPKASAAVALEKPKTKAITIDNAGHPRDRARRCLGAVRQGGRSAGPVAARRTEPDWSGYRQAGVRRIV